MPRHRQSALITKSSPVNGPFTFADLPNEEDSIRREQRDFLQNEVEAANRFLRSSSGRLLLAKFITVVSDGLDKENEEEMLRNRALVIAASSCSSATANASTTSTVVVPYSNRLSSSLAAYPSFLSMAEKFGAAENLISELLDGGANQIRAQLCYGVPFDGDPREPYEELNAFVLPPCPSQDKSWKNSFVTPLVCLVTRWAQNLTVECLGRLSPNQLSLLRFSIFITLVFEFAHVLVPFAVMFHKKLTFNDLYERGPHIWMTEKRPSPDPTPERMGFYLKTVGRESGDVFMHLWLGAPLRPHLCENAAENQITVFLPFGANPKLGKFLWPTLEASNWWQQLDEFFASGGRNSVIRHPRVAGSEKQNQDQEKEEPAALPWYQSFLCCCSSQSDSTCESLSLDNSEIDLFADMRHLIPESARRKIELWQELTDEQPEHAAGRSDENKRSDCEPLLENASPVKTWPPRSPRRDHRYTVKKSIGIPTLPSFEETEEEVLV